MDDVESMPPPPAVGLHGISLLPVSRCSPYVRLKVGSPSTRGAHPLTLDLTTFRTQTGDAMFVCHWRSIVCVHFCDSSVCVCALAMQGARLMTHKDTSVFVTCSHWMGAWEIFGRKRDSHVSE